MATHRKTRQQKIQATQRRPDVAETDTVVVTPAASSSGATVDVAGEYMYVKQDLKRIGLTSLFCFAILIVITILLSEFSVFEQIRQTLHLPTISF